MQIDAMADSYYDITPYHFGFNDPLFWSDPTGLASITNTEMDQLWNSRYGGSWNSDEGVSLYSSNTEALLAGASYINSFNIWGDDGAMDVDGFVQSLGNAISSDVDENDSANMPLSVDGMVFRILDPILHLPEIQFNYDLESQNGSLIIFLGNTVRLVNFSQHYGILSDYSGPFSGDYGSLDVNYYQSDKGFYRLPRSSAESSLREGMGSYFDYFWNDFISGDGDFLTNKRWKAIISHVKGRPYEDITFRFKYNSTINKIPYKFVINFNF